MSFIDSVILRATSILCSSGGSMDLQELQEELQERCGPLPHEDSLFIIQGCPQRFLLVPESGGVSVVARTSVRLCRSYSRGDPCGGCAELHLCRFFLCGGCRFRRARTPCKFSHDLQSDQNHRVLTECTLQELQQDQLFLLLLQNDPLLLPEVCSHYNKGPGQHGACSFMDGCSRLHLCQHFLRGDCRFGSACHKLHAVDSHGERLLGGLSRATLSKLPQIYRNMQRLNPAPPAGLPGAAQTDETKEICVHFIRKSCKFKEKCRRVHFRLPYKWEVHNGSVWNDLPNMEAIERDFCDPARTHSYFCPHQLPVDFGTMTCGSRPVRRLSTASSVIGPPHHGLSTQWFWYCKADHDTWLEYGAQDQKRTAVTSVTSEKLEEAFLSGLPEVKVKKGQRDYIICFRDMYQRNLKRSTKRRLRRRPRFVSRVDVVKLLAQSGKFSS